MKARFLGLLEIQENERTKPIQIIHLELERKHFISVWIISDLFKLLFKSCVSIRRVTIQVFTILHLKMLKSYGNFEAKHFYQCTVFS